MNVWLSKNEQQRIMNVYNSHRMNANWEWTAIENECIQSSQRMSGSWERVFWRILALKEMNSNGERVLSRILAESVHVGNENWLDLWQSWTTGTILLVRELMCHRVAISAVLDILVERDGRSELCVRHSDRQRSVLCVHKCGRDRSVLVSDSQRERERESSALCVRLSGKERQVSMC